MKKSKELRPVARVIVMEGNKFLLGRRHGSKDDNGKWVILGGGIDKTESPIEAAKREFLEESGRISTELELVFTIAYKDWLTYYYLCPEFSDIVSKPSKEHSEIAFVPFSELDKKNMGQNHYKILKKLLK